MKKSAQEIVLRTRGRDSGFDLNGGAGDDVISGTNVADRINGGKAANDEAIHEWRDAA